MNQKSYLTYRIFFKHIGSLLIILGLVEVFPLIVSLIFSEWYSFTGFLISVIITLVLGFSIFKCFNNSDEPQYNQVVIFIASGWLCVSILGGLPFFLIAHITPLGIMNQFIPEGAEYDLSSLLFFRNPLHCIFESMSGFTTTGLTMVMHEPSVGKGILFYRSFSQWIGGVGFIIVVLAVFREIPGRSAILLFGSENSGEKIRPRVIETARMIWKLYITVTLFSIMYLFIGTRIILPTYPIIDTIFDSINHAMAAQSTGGFSTLDDSIASYESASMEMLYLLPMMLGAFSIPFYFRVIIQKRFGEFIKDIQTRSLLIAFFLGSIIQSYLLFRANNISDPLRTGVFQFISALTTTGWQTSDIGSWDWLSLLFIISAMFVGGASGSTVGGIKMIRAIIILRVLRWQINKVFLSNNTVKSIKFDGKLFLPEEMNQEFTNAASLALMVFTVILISSFITFGFSGHKFNFLNVLFESASAQGTVGLSVGIVQPSMSVIMELIYIFQMWAGRLEVIPVLALIRAISLGIYPKNI